MDPDPASRRQAHQIEAASLQQLPVEIEFVRHDLRWPDDARFEKTMRSAAERAYFAAAPEDATGELTIVLSNDEEVRLLNRAWRQKDAATNVLSFPLHGPAEQRDRRFDPLPGPPPSRGTESNLGMIAGDIVLAYDTVAREAQARGIALIDHVAHLIAHGVLHILGHDHDSDEAAEAMEGLERRVLASLGIADPYAEACASAVQEERS